MLGRSVRPFADTARRRPCVSSAASSRTAHSTAPPHWPLPYTSHAETAGGGGQAQSRVFAQPLIGPVAFQWGAGTHRPRWLPGGGSRGRDTEVPAAVRSSPHTGLRIPEVVTG